MFPFKNGLGIYGPTSVVKRRRSRKKEPAPLDPETEKQERELRLKIQQSLHTQQKSRKEIEEDETQQWSSSASNFTCSDGTMGHPADVVGGTTERIHNNNNSNFASVLCGGVCMEVNSGMSYLYMGGMGTQQRSQQTQYQIGATNNQLHGFNHSQGTSIADSGGSEEAGGILNMARKIHQIELQFALQGGKLDHEALMKQEIEIQKLQAQITKQEVESQKIQAQLQQTFLRTGLQESHCSLEVLPSLAESPGFEGIPIHRNGTRGPNSHGETTLASKYTTHGPTSMNNADETVIGEKMPYIQHVSKGSSQYDLPGAEQFRQQRDSYHHASPEFTAAQSSLGNYSSHQLSQQLQQQTIRRQAEYLPFELRNHQARQHQQQQQLHLLHPYLDDMQQPGSHRPHNIQEKNGQPFNLQKHHTHQQEQQLYLLEQIYQKYGALQQRSDPPHNTRDYNGQDIQQYVTDKQQQVEQKSIPVPQESLLDESGKSLLSSMSESWLKGSTDSGYAFNSVNDSCDSFAQSMVGMMDTPEMTNPSKGDVMSSGRVAEAAEGRMNDSGNNRSKSARTDECGSGYDGADSARQKNKTNDNEAHGYGNTTSPFTRNEHDSSKDYKGSAFSNHASVMSNYTNSMQSIDSIMLEDMMKRSCKTDDNEAHGYGNTTSPFTRNEHDSSKDYKGSAFSNHASVMSNYTNSMQSIDSIMLEDMMKRSCKTDGNATAPFTTSVLSNYTNSIDSTMLEDMMKRSCKTFDTGVAGSDMSDTNVLEDYKHIFDSVDSGSSCGNKLTNDSASTSRDNVSTSGRSRRAFKRFIKPDISQWTKNNPFDDTEEGENDVQTSSSNNRSKSARMDISSSDDDVAQSIGLSKKTNDNDAHGDNSTTTPFKRSSLMSFTESIVALHPIEENDASECDSYKDLKGDVLPNHIDSLLSVDVEDSMKQSGRRTDSLVSNVSLVTDYENRAVGAVAPLNRDSTSISSRSRCSKTSNRSIMSDMSQWAKENPFGDSDCVIQETLARQNDLGESGLTLL